MTTNTLKTMVIGMTLTIFTFAAVSAYAWGNRQNQGRGTGQGLHTKRNAMYGQTINTSVNGNAGEQRGRDYVRLGETKELTGVLELQGTEWFIKYEDKTYALHMGPEDYRDNQGFSLNENDIATITGFVYKNDVAVKSITSAGKSIVLRDDSGRPAWAGSKFSNRQASK